MFAESALHFSIGGKIKENGHFPFTWRQLTDKLQPRVAVYRWVDKDTAGSAEGVRLLVY